MNDDMFVIPSYVNKLKLRLLSDIKEEVLRWLWYPYIPAGKVTMLEGDPGLGKSYITCAIAAAISAGRCLPGQVQCLQPQRVLMLSGEDGLADTMRPRLVALDAHLPNIMLTDYLFTLDRKGIFDLEEAIRATAVTIVFLDPIVSYMGAKIDMNKANEVRSLMGPLNDIATSTGTAIVAVRHLRKAQGKGDKAIYRGLGSIDFTAAVRSVLQVEEKNGVRFISHAKHNLSPEGRMIRYTIEDQTFKWGTFASSGAELTTKPRPLTELVLTIRAEIKELLANGPRSAQEMLDALSKYKRRPILDAKKGLVRSVKAPTAKGEWIWELHEESPHPTTTAPATPVPNMPREIPMIQPRSTTSAFEVVDQVNRGRRKIRLQPGAEPIELPQSSDTPAESAGERGRPGDSVTAPIASDAPAVAPRPVTQVSSGDPASVASVEKTPDPRPVTAPPDLTLPDFLDRALAAAKAKLGERTAQAI